VCRGGFSPLDQKLALRADHWSGGAARVATRLGLQAKSFALAAAGFSDTVGRDISGDSVARLTEAWGGRVAEQRRAEAELAHRPGRRGERLAQRRLPEDLNDMRCAPELGMVDIERVAEGKPARFSDCHGRAGLPPEDFESSLHAVIARAAHNTVLAAFGQAVSRAVNSPTWQRMMRQIYLSPRNNSFFLQQYEQLYDAIERRDAAAAESLMRQHLTALSATLNE